MGGRVTCRHEGIMMGRKGKNSENSDGVRSEGGSLGTVASGGELKKQHKEEKKITLRHQLHCLLPRHRGGQIRHGVKADRVRREKCRQLSR